ncbi:helix-turn-helix domain-containing protein [Fusibacter ferrireducens]|uniref:Helix-turn-helix transcriptional regulator n=1 Tax=Fusibacter ferrireducens TaxID=2785058 RepID=A0ABS0A041_9FIRM|nr:helix-turn-helix transcriptional regulator [Fusibacter ferrireducens]MBF4695505.1 helix-turn-helix transcriptional regulator [Fusibacter ferrireducens]
MFYTFNSSEFGKKLRIIRKKQKLTQNFVCQKLSMSIDGLGKIENGKVMPRFDTLVKMSQFYRINLIKLMSDSFKMLDLEKYYATAQECINCENIDELDRLILEIKNIISTGKNLDLILFDELTQFILFCESSLLFIKNGAINLSKAKNIAIDALKITIHNFNLFNFHEFNYSLFEIRLLHLLALIERRNENYYTAIDILHHLQKIMPLDKDNIAFIQLMNQVLFSLAYSYSIIEDHKNCLYYANIGIDYSIANNRLNELHLFYYRKGIAEFHLNNDQYIHSLRTSIALLEAVKNPLSDTYRTVSYEKYGIQII